MNDFVNFPEYSSPWLTPPMTPADAQLSPSCSANNDSRHRITDGATADSDCYKITGDEEGNILGWVRENTQMKLIDGSRKDRLNASSPKFNHHSFVSNKASVMIDVKPFPSCYDSSHVFNIVNNGFSQHSPKPRRSKPLPSIPNQSGPGGMDSVKSNSTRMDFFGSDGIKYVDKEVGRVDCEYHNSNDDDDDGEDLVMEFLEAYRKIPEISKFQSKVFLKLNKDNSYRGQPLFLCPDDSKKFITLHDFSTYQFQEDSGALCCCNNHVDECGSNIKDHHSSTHCRQSSTNNNCCSHIFPTQSPTMASISHNFINIDQRPTKYFNSNNCSKSSLSISVLNKFSTRTNDIQTNQLPYNHNINDIAGARKNVATSYLNKINSYSNKHENYSHSGKNFTDRTVYAKTYAFDRIFMSEEDVKKVYVESFSSVLKAAITGHDGCVVVYGDGEVHHRNGKVDKYGCIRLLMKWLFVLVEEASHDSSTSSFGIKMSASEMLVDDDSVRDLLVVGCDKEERSLGSESRTEQLKALRVTNYREASDIIDNFISVRTDAPSNFLVTVQMKRYHPPIPGQRRDISSINHLHMIKLSEKKQKKENDDLLLSSLISSHNQSSRQSQDNLISFIGCLMASPKSPLTETARIQKVLQDCIAPPSVPCQSCLLLLLSQNTTSIENMQKLLNLGTKIYKKRLSSKSRALRSGQSSPSEASSCASSGISSYRKSRVRMGTRQWQKQVASAVTKDAISSIPDSRYSNFARKQQPQQPVVTLTPIPTRPRNLQLKSVFGPKETMMFTAQSNIQLNKPPPLPSPLKGYWHHLNASRGMESSHVHDTILEIPEGEDRWDKMPANLSKLADSHYRPYMSSQETWVDGPASVMGSSYVNVSKFNRYYENKWSANISENADRPIVESGCCGTEHASHQFSSSDKKDMSSESRELRHKTVSDNGLLIQSRCSDAAYRVLTSSNNQSFYPISSLKKGFTCSIQPVQTFDESPASCLEVGCKKGSHDKVATKELLTERLKFGRQNSVISANNFRDKNDILSQSFGCSTFQQSSLDSNSLYMESGQVKNTLCSHNCFMSSSLYERQLEENLEDFSAANLSGIKYLASSKPIATTNSEAVGSYYCDVSTTNNHNLKTNVNGETNHFNINISRGTNLKNDINNNKDDLMIAAKINNDSIVLIDKKIKPEKYNPLKKLKQFFSKNPFKNSTSSTLSRIAKEKPIALNNANYTLPALPESVGSSKNPTCTILNQLNSSFDRSQKKRFSFFSRHRGSLVSSDFIATAPTTPNMYYDNHAANGTLGSVSGNGVNSFIFPSLVNRSRIAETKKVSLTSNHSSLDIAIARTAVPASLPATVFVKSERSMSLKEEPSPTNVKRAFFKEEDDDNRSQVESSVANVVCYKRIPFSKKTNDCRKAVVAPSSALEPSYYRFSKFSSDGDFDGDYATLDGYRGGMNHDNFNNNNNSNNSDDSISKSDIENKIKDIDDTTDYYDDDDDDGSDGGCCSNDDDCENGSSIIDCKFKNSKCNSIIISSTITTSCNKKAPLSRSLSSKKSRFGLVLKEKAVKRKTELLSRFFLCNVQ